MRVDFYITPYTTLAEKLQFTCRLVEKIYSQNKTTLILCDLEQIAQQLDELLWTFKDTSFLPHQVLTNETLTLYLCQQNPTPIWISCALPASPKQSILINYTNNNPKVQHSFSRVIEVIANNAIEKTSARIRYSKYREQSYSLIMHDLSKILMK